MSRRGGRRGGRGAGGDYRFGNEPQSLPVHGDRGGRGRGGGGGAGRAEVFDLSRQFTEGVHIGGSSSRDEPPVHLEAPLRSLPEAAALGGSLPPPSSKALVHTSRPGFGTVGKRCIVRANHFLVRITEKSINQYELNFKPELKSRALGRSIMKQLVQLYGESHLGGCMPAYDGRSILYVAGTLPFDSKEFELTHANKDGHEKIYSVSIRFAKTLDPNTLKSFLQGRQRDCPYDTIQALDVVLRQHPSDNYVTISRSFFSTKFGTDALEDGLECWKGYFQSLRPTQMGLSLNVDICATAFYKAVNVLEFVREYLNLDSIQQLFQNGLLEHQRIKICKALKGVRVATTHNPDVPRRYKIMDITQLPAREIMFSSNEFGGAEISVSKYLKEKYNCNLKYDWLPCIKAGSDTRAFFLPLEVCEIVEGQRYSKRLNDRQVTKILKSACQRPVDRENNIMKLVKQNNYSNDRHARSFGVLVDPNLVTVEARVLSPPRLKYHEKVCVPNVGQWNMIDKRMVVGGTVDAWACISFSRQQPNAVKNFCNELVAMCINKGMVFKYAPVQDIWCKPQSQIENSLKEFCSKATQSMNKNQGRLQLLIIVLPEASGSYGRIKRICETELGIVSQCCQPRHVLKCNKQYLENVALKINVKVGGCNTVLEDAITKNIPLVTDKPTIIFGADVTHPAPGEDSMASIAAVVASMDWPWITKYKGLVSAQSHRQEIIEELFKITPDPQRGNVPGGLIRELLIAFYRVTKQKPHRIIFYRDGVSEGQFNQVLLLEMDAIRKACASLEEGYLPPVTFVVVQKRHHTRLFPQEHNHRDLTDRSGNILPGTVVDRTICHPTEFDFYLCSHAGIQGTSRPTHYHVLFDENKFSADGLQTLTNNLCYTFARCTRAVSVVPPAFYAHLLAFRARYYMEGESDTASGSRNTRQRTALQSAIPAIKENVKEFMFYC